MRLVKQTRPVKQIRVKFALLISAFVASTFAAPKASNELTCTICVDVITDLDNFITDATTEEQIVAFSRRSATVSAASWALQLWRRSAMPCSRTTFLRSSTTSSTRILILRPSVPPSVLVHESIFSKTRRFRNKQFYDIQ